MNASVAVAIHDKSALPLGEHSAEVRLSTILPRALADFVRRRGVALEQVFGDDAHALLSQPAEHTVSLGEFQHQLARAIEATREPALGLLCGMQATDASFGLMAPLVNHAPSLRSALELACQFQGLVAVGAQLRLTERLGIARLECQVASYVTIDRSLHELVMAGLVRTLEGFGCPREDVRAVCFPYARPVYYSAYSRAFGGRERFAQSYAGVEFSSQALDRMHVHRDAELHAVMINQAQERLARVSRPLTCTERVRALLVGRRVSQLPDMPAAARELGISVRSLRRRLEQEGTTYRDLTQVMLHETACLLLRNPDVTLQGVAHALGFSEVTAFYRAFRRRSELTPAEYRAANGCQSA